jgi:alpha-beta hydrolase superfamily lysophospholipase
MRACYHIEIVTPKKVVLNGLWFGSRTPKRVIVWVHGLNSSAFSKLAIVDELVDASTAVVTFNNRGHDMLSRLVRVGSKKRRLGGGGAETFAECKDDIDGVINFVRSKKVKEVYIAGHSTGCQKAVYWASKSKKSPVVRGIKLLAPVSDYAAAFANYGEATMRAKVAYARAMARTGKGSELMPLAVWSDEVTTADRFLSLYTPESVEEIFSYTNPARKSILRGVSLPVLAFFAERDEYAGAPLPSILSWFDASIRSPRKRLCVIPSVRHSFAGGEALVAKEIKKWYK